MMKILDFIFYYMGKALVVFIMRVFFHEEIVNQHLIPKKGPYILAGNHTSWIDTLVIATAMKPKFWFVTGDFILDVPIMRTIVSHLGIIQMRKKHGKKGIEETIDKLNKGEIICIFPEGEITFTGETDRFRNGVSVIQRATNVPIVPFYLDGAIDVWSRVQPKLKLFKKVKITFGEPFYPKAEKDNDIANEIRDTVLALK